MGRDSVGVVVRVSLVSLVVSAVIKAIGPSLNLAATASNAWVGILLPPLAIAGLLLWRQLRGS